MNKRKVRITNTGYLPDSPDRHNPMNIIPSNQITMNKVPFPIMGIDNLGNSQMMLPGVDYTFPGQYVTEIPLGKYQKGKQYVDPYKDYYNIEGYKNLSESPAYRAYTLAKSGQYGVNLSGNQPLPKHIQFDPVTGYVYSTQKDNENAPFPDIDIEGDKHWNLQRFVMNPYLGEEMTRNMSVKKDLTLGDNPFPVGKNLDEQKINIFKDIYGRNLLKYPDDRDRAYNESVALMNDKVEPMLNSDYYKFVTDLNIPIEERSIISVSPYTYSVNSKDTSGGITDRADHDYRKLYSIKDQLLEKYRDTPEYQKIRQSYIDKYQPILESYYKTYGNLSEEDAKKEAASISEIEKYVAKPMTKLESLTNEYMGLEALGKNYEKLAELHKQIRSLENAESQDIRQLNYGNRTGQQPKYKAVWDKVNKKWVTQNIEPEEIELYNEENKIKKQYGGLTKYQGNKKSSQVKKDKETLPTLNVEADRPGYWDRFVNSSYNPFNWGLPDYSKLSNPTDALYQAAYYGEPEFMWRGRRTKTADRFDMLPIEDRLANVGKANFSDVLTFSTDPEEDPSIIYVNNFDRYNDETKFVPIENVKQYQKAYTDALQYTKDWMDSPMYNKMLKNSAGESYENLKNWRRGNIDYEDPDVNVVNKTHSIDDTDVKAAGWSSGHDNSGVSIVNDNDDLASEQNRKNREYLNGLTHYAKNPEEKNKSLFEYNYQNQEDIKKWLNSLFTHEFSHESDYNKNWGSARAIPKKDVDYMLSHQMNKKQSDTYYENLFYRNNPRDFSNNEEWKDFYNDYVGKPTETRARLQEIRRYAKDKGIYDPFIQELDQKTFERLLNEYNEVPGLNSLIPIYKPEEIRYMLNNISENKSNKNNIMTNDIQQAKQGGMYLGNYEFKNGGLVKMQGDDSPSQVSPKGKGWREYKTPTGQSLYLDPRFNNQRYYVDEKGNTLTPDQNMSLFDVQDNIWESGTLMAPLEVSPKYTYKQVPGALGAMETIRVDADNGTEQIVSPDVMKTNREGQSFINTMSPFGGGLLVEGIGNIAQGNIGQGLMETALSIPIVGQTIGKVVTAPLKFAGREVASTYGPALSEIGNQLGISAPLKNVYSKLNTLKPKINPKEKYSPNEYIDLTKHSADEIDNMIQQGYDQGIAESTSSTQKKLTDAEIAKLFKPKFKLFKSKINYDFNGGNKGIRKKIINFLDPKENYGYTNEAKQAYQDFIQDFNNSRLTLGENFPQTISDDTYKIWADQIYPNLGSVASPQELREAHTYAVNYFKDHPFVDERAMGLVMRERLAPKIADFQLPQFRTSKGEPIMSKSPFTELQAPNQTQAASIREALKRKLIGSGKKGKSLEEVEKIIKNKKASGDYDLQRLNKTLSDAGYTPEERNLINAYAKGFDHSINNVLRANHDLSVLPENTVNRFYLNKGEELKQAILKNKVNSEDIPHVFRGVSNHDVELIDPETLQLTGKIIRKADLQKGDHFLDRGFVSTTYGPDRAGWGTFDASEKILIPPGKKLSGVAPNTLGHSFFPNEREIVLPSGLIRRVDDVFEPTDIEKSGVRYLTSIMNPYKNGGTYLGKYEFRDGGLVKIENDLDTYAYGGKVVSEIWTEKTGLPWSAAKKLGLSDGSYDRNIQLRKELIRGEHINLNKNPQVISKPRVNQVQKQIAKPIQQITAPSTPQVSRRPQSVGKPLSTQYGAYNWSKALEQNTQQTSQENKAQQTFDNQFKLTNKGTLPELPQEEPFKYPTFAEFQKQKLNNALTATQPRSKSKVLPTENKRGGLTEKDQAYYDLLNSTKIEYNADAESTARTFNNIQSLDSLEKNKKVQDLILQDAIIESQKSTLNPGNFASSEESEFNLPSPSEVLRKMFLPGPFQNISIDEGDVKDFKESATKKLEEYGILDPSTEGNLITFEQLESQQQPQQNQIISNKESNTHYIPPTQIAEDNNADYGEPENKFWGFRYQNDNDIGLVYVATPRREKLNKNSKFSNVKGVAHFLIQTDATDGFIHPETKKHLEKDLKEGKKYVPFIKKEADDKVRLKYAKGHTQQETFSKEGYEPFTTLRTLNLSDIDWSKSGRPTGFRSGISNVLTKEGKDTWLVYKEATGKSKKLGQFNGGALVFIIETPEGRIIRDFTGTIQEIENESKRITKEFNVPAKDVTLGFYDAGSYTAKPKADKNNELYFNQYSGFNVADKISGAALMIPSNLEQGGQMTPSYKNGGLVRMQEGGSKEIPLDLPLKEQNIYLLPEYNQPINPFTGEILPDMRRPNLGMNTGATEYKYTYGTDEGDIDVPSIIAGQYIGDKALDRYNLTGERFKTMNDPGSYSKFYDEMNQLGLMQERNGGAMKKVKIKRLPRNTR